MEITERNKCDKQCDTCGVVDKKSLSEKILAWVVLCLSILIMLAFLLSCKKEESITVNTTSTMQSKRTVHIVGGPNDGYQFSVVREYDLTIEGNMYYNLGGKLDVYYDGDSINFVSNDIDSISFVSVITTGDVYWAE